MSNRPGAPAELPPMSGDNAAPVPRPKTPRASKVVVTAGQRHGDSVVAVKQGSRAAAAPYGAAGVVTAVLCCIGIWIAIGVALSNDCGAAEPRCARAVVEPRRSPALLASACSSAVCPGGFVLPACAPLCVVTHVIHRGALTQQRSPNQHGACRSCHAHGAALPSCCLHRMNTTTMVWCLTCL